VILEEVEERSVQTDFRMSYFRRQGVKLTFQMIHFKSYFGIRE